MTSQPKRGLTISVVFEANSLNYGEGIGNIAELKKLHRANGNVHTFASRQSVRYDIIRLGNELFGWNLDTVHDKKKVVQFKPDVTIEDSVEMDLFGYLKTDKKSQKRAAVARLSHSISLEPYQTDMEFLNNMGLAERIGGNVSLANIEQHESLYTYTITIDLTKVGKDGEIELPAGQKNERVQQLLDIIKILNRNIRGRQESLAPLFVIGGVYSVANPFFLGKIRLDDNAKAGTWELSDQAIKDQLEQTFAGREVKEDTRIGLVGGKFANEAAFKELASDQSTSMEQFFKHLSAEVATHFGV